MSKIKYQFIEDENELQNKINSPEKNSKRILFRD